MSHSIVWETQGVYIKFCGLITARDVERALQSALSDPRFNEAVYRIFDYTEASSPSTTIQDIEEWIAWDYADSFSNPRALSVNIAADLHMLALNQHWMDNHVHPQRRRLCNSLEQARAWIGGELARRGGL